MGFGDRHTKYGEWLDSNLALSTSKHVKGVMYTSGHANRDSCVSPNSYNGNALGAVILDVMKCTTNNVFLNCGRGATDLGLTVETLFQARRGNHRVSRKEKRICVSNGKLLTASGGKHLLGEIEDISNLSCAPRDSGQHSQSEN